MTPQQLMAMRAELEATLLGNAVQEMAKEAAVKEDKPQHPAVTLGKYVAGFGAGTAAGYGGMKAVDYGLKKLRGKGLPKGGRAAWAVPLAVGAGGLALAHVHERTLDKMRADHLKRQEEKRERKES